VIQNHIENISLYKKALAGILINLQQEIFSFLNQIEENNIHEEDIDAIILFIKTS